MVNAKNPAQLETTGLDRKENRWSYKYFIGAWVNVWSRTLLALTPTLRATLNKRVNEPKQQPNENISNIKSRGMHLVVVGFETMGVWGEEDIMGFRKREAIDGKTGETKPRRYLVQIVWQSKEEMLLTSYQPCLQLVLIFNLYVIYNLLICYTTILFI